MNCGVTIMEIECFDYYIGMLALAKALHDIDRFDIVENHFEDKMCSDSYYENVLNVIAHIFTGHEEIYDESDGTELLFFGDDVISDYFVHAWEYGIQNNIPYKENPYVAQAKEEARGWFTLGCCLEWKLASYVRTKKSARQSQLIILIGNGCGNCAMHENVAYGLIQMYAWFSVKCAEFKELKEKKKNDKAADYAVFDFKPKSYEVIAA